MKTHDRWAVEKDGQWLLPRRHRGNTWTKRSQNARLFLRHNDAASAAEEFGGRLVTVEVSAA